MDVAQPIPSETFLAEFSARFINIASKDFNDAVEDAQRLMSEHFALDRSALFQVSEENPEEFQLTHLYQSQAAAGPRLERQGASLASTGIGIREGDNLGLYTKLDLRNSFPHSYQLLVNRQTVVIPDVATMPPEAAADQEILRSYGTKATVIVPLFLGVDWLGCLTFAATRERRQWSTVDLRCFEFAASVFGNALARNRAEQRLLESELRFRTLVEQAGDGFELLDEAGRYLDVNAATLQQLGYSREEMLRLSVFDVDPLADRVRFAEESRSANPCPPWRVESVHRRKDGTTFPVEVTIASVQIGGRRCRLTLVRDITARKNAEDALTKSYTEIKLLKDRLEAESAYLKTEIRVTHAHGQIIGQSSGIKQVLHQAEQVAAADCAVLLSGETGTGKELIAQEIHRLSRRRERLMVLVNCAALPSALVESELFGRERGAYTGALTAQIGRFQVADGSSIFLDEVGELSMEVQAKLLRVLQEGEFQRLGNPKTVKVDVRVIAASNRNLAEEVHKGRFREDLYYRLKVFPIEIPPLRERSEDIPSLVFAFVEEFSTRMGKKITKVPRNAMEKLQGHSWPGNIRELRNVIEHSVILSSGDMLKLSVLGDTPIRELEAVTLAEVEREHILKILERTGWRIKGPRGAAERLGLEPSTLYSRMQKLGIPNRRQKDEMVSS